MLPSPDWSGVGEGFLVQLPQPNRWQEQRSSGIGCLRSVRTGWQESDPPSEAKPEI